MTPNINTATYWDKRFSTGDWEICNGRRQTRNFAIGQMPYLQIDRNFNGTLLDFGCGLGDAMPVYRARFPKANLIGIDISRSAIEQCRERYGAIASFVEGGYHCVPSVDIIIASNVFEHLTDDREIAMHLLNKCHFLYIIVPYKEDPLYFEHINSYDECYFSSIAECTYKIFPCKGWSVYGRDLWYEIYLKNIVRFLLRRPLRQRSKQIVFRIKRGAQAVLG